MTETKVDAIMEKVQVFASAYSLAGGKFDDGTKMAQSNAEKDELRQMIASAIKERTEAPAHPTWAGKTEAWKFIPKGYLQQVMDDYVKEKGLRSLGDLVLLGDFAEYMRNSLETGLKAIMNPVSGLNLERPDIAAISEGEALHLLLDDIRSLWNELGAPGTFVGSTQPLTDDEHKNLQARIIDNTRAGHDVDLPEKTPLHGVYIAGTSHAICVTGNTPLAHRRATLISMLLSAIPGIFVMVKMAEANLRAQPLDPEAVALLTAEIPATVAPSNEN